MIRKVIFLLQFLVLVAVTQGGEEKEAPKQVETEPPKQAEAEPPKPAETEASKPTETEAPKKEEKVAESTTKNSEPSEKKAATEEKPKLEDIPRPQIEFSNPHQEAPPYVPTELTPEEKDKFKIAPDGVPYRFPEIWALSARDPEDPWCEAMLKEMHNMI